MKNIFYLTLIVLGVGFAQPSEAQVRVNVNIGSQPLWGPVGYDFVRYYYMPEIDVYYNVSNRKYTYYQGNRWVTKSKLPGRYKKFDLYRTYKVVMNDRDPWHRHGNHRNQYGRYAKNYSQVVHRDRGNRRGHYEKHDRRDDRHKNHKINKRSKYDDKGRHHNDRGRR